jgi:hypothetical protein
MYTRLFYRIAGYLSVIIGILCLLSMFKIGLLFYGIMLAIPGFFVSGYNIYLNNKYEFDEKKWPLGYLGMFLCSLPVLFMLLVVFKYKK